MFNLKKIFLLFFLCYFSFLIVLAETITIYPVADTYADMNEPTTNYGTEDYLITFNYASYYMYSFLKFSSSDFPDGTINSAILYLYGFFCSGNPTLEFRRCSSDWTETGLTYLNMPGVTGGAVNINILDSETGYFAINITDIVNNWKTTGNYGLRISTVTDLSYVYFYSREYGTGYTPYLVINYDSGGLPTIIPTSTILISPTFTRTQTQTQTLTPTFTLTFTSSITPTPTMTPTISIAEAVDNYVLTWATGGNADWYGQSAVYYYGGDAAQSGVTGNNQSTYLETEVTGPGILSFYWKVSSESGYDFLIFNINNQLQDQISGEVNWTQKIYNLGSGNYTLQWAYTKDASYKEGSDCGWIDLVSWTQMTATITPTMTPTISIAEAVDNYVLIWVTGGNANWYGQSMVHYYGGDSAQSGVIGDNQATYLETEVTGPGILSFYWKVSSEWGFDFLKFYINNQLQVQISGISNDWVYREYVLDSGNNTLRWEYVKDDSGSSGSDCGWLDYVIWKQMTSTITPTITSTPTFTITFTITLTYTNTSTSTITLTQTPTSTFSNTFTYTITPTNTETFTATLTYTITDTFTETPSFTITETITQTMTATMTFTITETATITVTQTNTLIVTSTTTPTETETVTVTVTDTTTLTATQTVTVTNTPTVTLTLTYSETQTTTPTETETVTVTVTDTITLTATQTVTVTNTPTVTLTSTYSETPTEISTIAETLTATSTITQTETSTETQIFTLTITLTTTPTVTATIIPTYFYNPTISPTPTIFQIISCNLLIDDMDDGDDTCNFGGLWYSYNDCIDDGDSYVVPWSDCMWLNSGQSVQPFYMQTPGRKGVDFAARITGYVTTKFPYGFIGMGVYLFSSKNLFVDISQCLGIKFWHKGDGKIYKIKLKSLHSGFLRGDRDDHYVKQFITTSDWKQEEILLENFSQEYWGSIVDRNEAMQMIYAIDFQTNSQPHSSIDLWIDEIELFNCSGCLTPVATIIVTPTSTPYISQQELLIYPQPYTGNGQLYLKINSNKKPDVIIIKIYTISLRLIKEIECRNFIYSDKYAIIEIEKDVSNLANGMYLFTTKIVEGDRETKTKIDKFIVLKNFKFK